MDKVGLACYFYQCSYEKPVAIHLLRGDSVLGGYPYALFHGFQLAALMPAGRSASIQCRAGFVLSGVSTGETQWAGNEAQSLNGSDNFALGQTFGQATDASQLTIGYQINRALGLELRHADYGIAQQSFAIRDGTLFIIASVNTQAVEAQDFTLLVKLGHQFVSGFNLFVEAGLSLVRSDSTIFDSGGADHANGTLIPFDNYSQRGTAWGAGAEYAILRDIAVQLRWQHHGYDGMKLETATLGVQFGF